MKKRWGWIVLAIFIVLVVLRVATQKRKITVKTEEMNAIPVRVEKPRFDSIEDVVSFVGDIKGEEEATVYAEAPGRLIEYKVREGDKVEKDAVIALLDRAQTGMDFEPLKVKAPISGTIGRLYLDKGANVLSQLAVALVTKMDRIKVGLNIPEKLLTKIQAGQLCRVKVDVYKDRIFKGKVKSKSPVLNPQDRTFYVEIELDNPGYVLRSGMFCEVSIILEGKKGILVSKEALISSIEKEKYYIFTVENNKAVKKEVKTGISKTDVVEIRDGLSVEDDVIIVGHEFLKGSEDVKVVE